MQLVARDLPRVMFIMISSSSSSSRSRSSSSSSSSNMRTEVQLVRPNLPRVRGEATEDHTVRVLREGDDIYI